MAPQPCSPSPSSILHTRIAHHHSPSYIFNHQHAQPFVLKTGSPAFSFPYLHGHGGTPPSSSLTSPLSPPSRLPTMAAAVAPSPLPHLASPSCHVEQLPSSSTMINSDHHRPIITTSIHHQLSFSCNHQHGIKPLRHPGNTSINTTEEQRHRLLQPRHRQLRSTERLLVHHPTLHHLVSRSLSLEYQQHDNGGSSSSPLHHHASLAIHDPRQLHKCRSYFPLHSTHFSQGRRREGENKREEIEEKKWRTRGNGGGRRMWEEL